MNPLQVRLAALRRRLRLVVTFRGVSWVSALLLLVLALRTACLSGAVAGAFALVLALSSPQLAQTAFLRLAHPFGGYDWPRQTQLDVKARSRVARGEAFEIQAAVTGVIPERAVVEYRFEGAPAAREVYQITRTEGAQDAGKLTARLEAGRVQRHFRYQLRANVPPRPGPAVELW